MVKFQVYLAKVLLLSTVILAGCMMSGKSPLETLSYQSIPEKNKNLIVFLRGMGGTLNCPIAGHKCFETEGFVEAVKKRGLPYDMVAPNAHFGYYEDRTLEERLTEDVIKPAKASGYEKIWLVGVSMGGFGSILYLKNHTEDITGVLTLGPFLGYQSIIDEISKAGGLKQWTPGPYDKDEDWQRMLWDWLKQYNGKLDGRPPIYLGIGDDDPYYVGQELLASYLPQDRVIVTDGGHRFSTFKKIWDIFLDNQILQ